MPSTYHSSHLSPSIFLPSFPFFPFLLLFLSCPLFCPYSYLIIPMAYSLSRAYSTPPISHLCLYLLSVYLSPSLALSLPLFCY